MAYITIKDFLNVIKGINLEATDSLEGDVYEKDIFFLSKEEKKYLLAIRALLNGSDNIDIKPVEVTKDYHFVFKGHKPEYHKNQDCRNLQRGEMDFLIPDKIIKQGEEKVAEYKEWFSKNHSQQNDNNLSFLIQAKEKFGLTSFPVEIHPKTSVTDKNLDSVSLKRKLDAAVKKAEDYFHKCSPEQQEILKKYLSHTYTAYREGRLTFGDFVIKKPQVIGLLKSFEKNYKRPVKRLLLDYYLYKQQAANVCDLNQSLLDKIGFDACGSCHQN